MKTNAICRLYSSSHDEDITDIEKYIQTYKADAPHPHQKKILRKNSTFLYFGPYGAHKIEVSQKHIYSNTIAALLRGSLAAGTFQLIVYKKRVFFVSLTVLRLICKIYSNTKATLLRGSLAAGTYQLIVYKKGFFQFDSSQIYLQNIFQHQSYIAKR